MFEINKIRIEYQSPKILALVGLEFHSYSPWEDNPKFDECVFEIHGRNGIRLSQLEQIKKLFKPNDILIPLNPREEPRNGEYMSLLFEKDNPPSREQMQLITSLKDYLHPVDTPETSLE